MKIKKFVNESPIVGIMAAQLQLNRVLEKTFAVVNLSYLEALVLVTIFFEGPRVIGPSEIARSVYYPLPRVSTAISSLQTNGLVAREFVGTDSRRFGIKLTSTGARRATQAVGLFDSIQSQIEDSLGAGFSSQVNKGLLKLRNELARR